jgi:hypothetical protein
VRITKSAKLATGMRVWVTETREANYIDKDGRFGRAGATHRIKEVNLGTGDWTRIGGRWLVQHEVALARNQFLDGKPAHVEIGRTPIDPSIKEDLQVAYDGLYEAIRQRDRAGAVAYLVPGTKLYRQMGQLWNQLSAMQDISHLSVTIERVEEGDKGIIATTRYSSRFDAADNEGKYGPKGKVRHHRSEGHSFDTWVKRESGWKLLDQPPSKDNIHLVDGRRVKD